MKYFAGVFMILVMVGILIQKPWPNLQFVLLFIIAFLNLYISAFKKVFQLTSLPKIKNQGSAYAIFGFLITLFIGAPFAIVIFPWLEQCVAQKQLIAPIPMGFICFILLAIPIGIYGIRLVVLKIADRQS